MIFFIIEINIKKCIQSFRILKEYLEKYSFLGKNSIFLNVFLEILKLYIHILVLILIVEIFENEKKIYPINFFSMKYDIQRF